MKWLPVKPLKIRTMLFIRTLVFGIVTVSVFNVSAYAQTNPDTTADATAPMQANAVCGQQDAITPQPSLQRAFPPVCGTILPSLFGLRNDLTADGIGFSLAFDGPTDFTYDLLGHNAKTQLYGGQNPTYTTETQLTISYNLDRLGFSDGTQLVVQATAGSSSDSAYIPQAFTISQLAVSQPLFHDDLNLRYGYIPLIYNFYGFVLGGNAAGAASGISSVIPIETGLSATEGTPTFEIIAKDPANRNFYDNFAVTRSTVPGSAQANINPNPTGLDLNVRGAGPLLVNEAGFGDATKPLWLRFGGIMNYSDYPNYKTGGFSQNYDLYAAITAQLYTPDNEGHGLYLDLKVDDAAENVNLFARDYTATLFYRGPPGLPFDTAAVGVGQSFFGTAIRRLMASQGGFDPTSTFSTTVSYVHFLERGIFLSSSLTYTTNPATVFKQEPSALIGSFGVQLFF